MRDACPALLLVVLCACYYVALAAVCFLLGKNIVAWACIMAAAATTFAWSASR